MDSRARPTIDGEEGEEGASLMRGEGVHLEHGSRVRAYARYRMYVMNKFHVTGAFRDCDQRASHASENEEGSHQRGCRVVRKSVH